MNSKPPQLTVSSGSHKCPICGKVFTTKRALAQHGQAKHGWTPPPKPKPRRTNPNQPAGAGGFIPRGNPGNTSRNSRQIGIIPTPGWGYCEKIFHQLVSIGCSLDGAGHVIHAVDPACPEGIPWNGIPDDNTTRILARRIINTKTITKMTKGTGNWDCAIMTCWSPHAEFVWFQQKTNGAWNKSTLNEDYGLIKSRFSRTNWQTVTRFRQAYGSITIHMDASATQTEGTVFAMQKVPERYVENVYQSASADSQLPNDLEDSSTEDEESDVESWTDASDITVRLPTTVGGGDKNTARLLCEYVGKWSDADMSYMDPGFYTAEAFKGVYSVCRLAGPRVWSVGSWTDEGGVDRWRVVAPLGTHHDFDQNSSPLVSNDTFQPYTNGWIIIKNLDPNAQLVVKTVRGYEMEVNAQSIAALDTRFSPDSDPLALHIETQLLRNLPSGGPASDNDFGDILSGALDVIFAGLTAVGGPYGAVIGPAGAALKKMLWR